MTIIEDFIKNELGKPNTTPRGLIREAYAMGLAHGKGEEYEVEQEEEVLEEPMQEEEAEDIEEQEEEEGAEEEEEAIRNELGGG